MREKTQIEQKNKTQNSQCSVCSFLPVFKWVSFLKIKRTFFFSRVLSFNLLSLAFKSISWVNLLLKFECFQRFSLFLDQNRFINSKVEKRQTLIALSSYSPSLQLNSEHPKFPKPKEYKPRKLTQTQKFQTQTQKIKHKNTRKSNLERTSTNPIRYV